MSSVVPDIHVNSNRKYFSVNKKYANFRNRITKIPRFAVYRQ